MVTVEINHSDVKIIAINLVLIAYYNYYELKEDFLLMLRMSATYLITLWPVALEFTCLNKIEYHINF